MKTKTDSLERRMDKMESTLDEIKSLLTEKGYDAPISRASPNLGRESELSPSIKRKINNIMDNFNFDKVHDVMVALDWRWVGANKGAEPPSIEQLRTEAKRLLVDAAYEKQTIATGGFRANYEKETVDDPIPYLSLEFIVTDWEGDETDEDDENDDWEV